MKSILNCFFDTPPLYFITSVLSSKNPWPFSRDVIYGRPIMTWSYFLLSDFMDALCDPRAFLSAQEKRAEQLKALGIEETDISKDVIQSKGPAGGGNG